MAVKYKKKFFRRFKSFTSYIYASKNYGQKRKEKIC